jgi:hypothetical protein
MLARQAILTHTDPMDLVIDPICGSGDIVVEAVKADRMAIGFEREPYWVDMARTRIEQVTDSGRGGFGTVVRGTADTLVGLIEPDCGVQARLVITAPQTGTVTQPLGTATASDLTEFMNGAVSATACCTPLLAQDGVTGVVCWPSRGVNIAECLRDGYVAAGFALTDHVTLESTSISLMLFTSPDTNRNLPERGNSSDLGGAT